MKKKKKVKFSNILSIIYILVSIYLMRSIYLFTGVETLIRYFIIGFLIFIDLLIILKIFVIKNKKKIKDKVKDKKKSIGTILYNSSLILLMIIYMFLAINLNNIYSYFSNLNKNITYSTSLVTLSENSGVNLSSLKGAKIGILSDTSSQDGYILAKEIIEREKLGDDNELVSFDSYPTMINALYEKEVDYIFLPTNYSDIFSTTEGFEDLGTKVKTVTTTEKEASKEEVELLGSAKDISEPFTILLIGIDSTTNGLKQADSFNGDSLMVVTFNPATMNATMLSIPRDSYVPIACFPGKYENKITHSASRGTSCVINTIEDFLDVEIDYYMKINFTGLVDLVNALGGIDVDVPYSFCEQNSKRKFGNSTIYVTKGYQTLNGEQALAFSRNRKSNAQYCSKEWTQGTRSDFVRASNQQAVIQAILNKMKDFTSIDKVKSVLSVISDNLDTNMKEETILSFYNIAKDVMLTSSSDEVLSIQKLVLFGYGQYIYDETSKLQLWNYVPNKRSVEDIKNAMKINLGLKEHETIKTFSYSINEGYETTTIGSGPYSSHTTYDLLIDLTRKDLAGAESWAKKNNITLKIEYVSNEKYDNGKILEQDYPVNKRLDKITNRTVTIKVVKNEEVIIPSKVDCLEDENNSVCVVPDFISKSKSDVTTWGSNFSNTVALYFEYKESDEVEGTIINQSVKSGTTVKELLEKNTTLTITIAKKKVNTPTDNEDEKKEDSSKEDTGQENNSDSSSNNGNTTNNNNNNSNSSDNTTNQTE